MTPSPPEARPPQTDRPLTVRELRAALTASEAALVQAEERNKEQTYRLNHWRKRAEQAEERIKELEDALRRIAFNDPPEDSQGWGSGRSWRIELAKAAVSPEKN